MLRIEDFGDFGPGRLLAVVDLPKVEQMSLHPTSMRAYLFGDAPTAVVLAVFEPVMTLQKRFGHSLASTLSHQAAPWEEGRSAPNTVLRTNLRFSWETRTPDPQKRQKPSPVAKVGLERVLIMELAAGRRHHSQAGGPRYVAKASRRGGRP